VNRAAILTVTIELAVAVACGVLTLGLYLIRSEWRSPVGRLIMAWIAVGLAEALSLFCLALWRIPVWIFVFVFGAVDVVYLWRLATLWKSQQNGEGLSS
jgi:hypothetical protein